MDCTITTITTTRKRRFQSGVMLVEMLMTTALSSILFAAILTIVLYSARSNSALANYVDLDKASRSALDKMSREIRQSNRLLAYSSTNLSFELVDPSSGATNNLSYFYDRNECKLKRRLNLATTTLLKDILPNTLTFSIFQRNPVGGVVDQYATTNAAECKVVQFSWVCSRSVLGKTVNSESAQSAKVVIRKE